MTSAAFTIIWMKIKVEWNSIIFCSFGATIGIVFGLEYVDQLINGILSQNIFYKNTRNINLSRKIKLFKT